MLFKRTNLQQDKEIYIWKRNEAKEAVKQAKNTSQEDLGKKSEEKYNENQK